MSFLLLYKLSVWIQLSVWINFTIEHVRFTSLDSQFNIKLLRFALIIKFFNINIFASLRNKCLSYRKCSLRFNIEENIIIEAFPSLRFDTCLHYRGTYLLLLEVSTPQGPELHLNVSALLRYVLLLEVSTPQGPELHLNVSALPRPVLRVSFETSFDSI